MARVRPEDVLTLIYTSGTPVRRSASRSPTPTSPRNAASSDRRDGGSVISFLPLAHIADRGLTHYAQMIWGYTVTTCPDPSQVFADVVDARPTRLGSVPRTWEKLKTALEAGIAGEPAKRPATLDAIELGLRKVRAARAGVTVPDELLAAYERARRRRLLQDPRLGFAPLPHAFLERAADGVAEEHKADIQVVEGGVSARLIVRLDARVAQA